MIKKQNNKEDKIEDITVTEKSNNTVRDKLLEKKSKTKSNKVKFEVWRMWLYYLGTLFAKDRGLIPDNIGNKILITSNMYITKLFLSSIIQVNVMGLNVPITTVEELTRYLREKKCTTVVDATWKRQRMDINPTDAGLKSRIDTWKSSMDKDFISDVQKETNARCIYTTEQLEAGIEMCYTRMYITLRAKTGSELKTAERHVGDFFKMIGVIYQPVTSNVKEVLEYITLLSDSRTKNLKDSKALVTSDLTLAQMFPNTGAYNGYKGLWAGVNILNNSHFKIDFDSITIARNIYLLAPPGVGKTVLSNNLVSSALEKPNWRVCAMDIKGNELINSCESVNGLILDLTPKSREYINSFKMDARFVGYDEAQDYYAENFNLSKKTMITLGSLSSEDELNEANILIDKFLSAMYNNIGVDANNKNTWSRTDGFNAYVVYDKFVEYMTASILSKYPLSGKKLLDNLRQYMSRTGSKSYVFMREFDMTKVYSSKMIVFNFGMLLYGSDLGKVDTALFKLKFYYSQRINGAYVSYNYSNNFETFKVLEESQIVPDELLHTYVEEFTMRRAQRQTNLLIGNSIHALLENKISKSLIETTRALLIGDLPEDAREEVIKQFDLQQHRKLIMKVGSNEEFSNSFVFVNRMQSDAITPVIKLMLDKKVLETTGYKQFTPRKTNII